ncbi:hypothetical protein CRENBAI_009661 [Crenichthys baileyi]|uniref:Uncharacterized protein n=1 Tax=Crenichthys baileyi TaxID=28760 RepID=A0AAV9R5P6_9TELE
MQEVRQRSLYLGWDSRQCESTHTGKQRWAGRSVLLLQCAPVGVNVQAEVMTAEWTLKTLSALLALSLSCKGEMFWWLSRVRAHSKSVNHPNLEDERRGLEFIAFRLGRVVGVAVAPAGCGGGGWLQGDNEAASSQGFGYVSFPMSTSCERAIAECGC